MRIVTVWMLIISPGVSWAATERIKVENGTVGGSLTLLCSYARRLIWYNHYWCRGAQWRSCSILVQSTGSEEEVQKGRFSIKDNHSTRILTVTMRDLTLEDAGVYWCGTGKTFSDESLLKIKVIIFPPLLKFNKTEMPSTLKMALPEEATSCPITESGIPWTVAEDMNATSPVPSSTITGDTEAPTSPPAPERILQSLVATGLLVIFFITAITVMVILRNRRKFRDGQSVQRDANISLANLPPDGMLENTVYATVDIQAALDPAPVYTMIQHVPSPAVPEPCHEEIQSLYSEAKESTNRSAGQQPITTFRQGYDPCSTAEDDGYSTVMAPRN